MEKLTAIEWLVSKLEPHLYPDFELVDLINQAKEMEKQQIIDAANTLLYPGTGPGDTWAEQYYNKTYKNK